jgi:hypothetical protein
MTPKAVSQISFRFLSVTYTADVFEIQIKLCQILRFWTLSIALSSYLQALSVSSEVSHRTRTSIEDLGM